MRFKKRGKRN